MNLQSLNLSMNSLSDLTCVPLAYNMHCNGELANLNLGLNYLGEATGTAFAKVLRVNCSLRVLNLKGIKISKQTAA